MKSEQLRKSSQASRKKWIRRIIRDRTFGKFENLKQYVSEIENKFKSDLGNLSRRFDEQAAEEEEEEEVPPDIKYELNEYFVEEYYVIERVFLRTFRYTIVVAVYSLLETCLNRLCHHLCNSKKLHLLLEELRGKGIERAKLYLAKVCSIDFPEVSNDWNQLQKLNKIRNCIVHAEGNIHNVKSPGTLRNIIKNTKGLELYNDRYIQIDSLYIVATIGSAENVLGCIYEKAL